MDNQQLLKKLSSLPSETEWLEFKVNHAAPDEIGEYISALSNSAALHDKPVAYLIFGINDKSHKLVGTDFKFSAAKVGNEELEGWLARLLNPRVDFRVEEFDLEEKHFILFVIDPTHNQPLCFKNTAFIRVGSYKKKLKDYPEKERKIWIQYNNTTFEEEIAQSNCSDDEVLRLLDYPTYFDLLSLNLPNNKMGIINKLQEERFIDKNQHGKYDILNLGAILFAKNLAEFKLLSRKKLRIILYQENGRLNTIKEFEPIKGYAAAFNEIVNYIIDQLPQNEVIEKATRHQVKMYPDVAIRELVANALIHQDFSQRGTSTMVEIFKSRIEITNPGKPLINTLRFIDHNPKSRNEQLASFFRRVDFCEERGSGIDKVISSIESYQLPAPEFIEGDYYLRVIVYSHRPLREMGRKDRVRACYQHCCLKYVSGDIATNKSLRTRFEIAEKNYSIVSRIIADTIDEGLIKPADPDSKSRKHASYIPFWI